jgi:hypothetical protein
VDPEDGRPPIALAKADEIERERRRLHMEEPYGTPCWAVGQRELQTGLSGGARPSGPESRSLPAPHFGSVPLLKRMAEDGSLC